jgi:hypothetical protein
LPVRPGFRTRSGVRSSVGVCRPGTSPTSRSVPPPLPRLSAAPGASPADRPDSLGAAVTSSPGIGARCGLSRRGAVRRFA